ncbi:MAG: protein kinase domain-containing protein, partial [Micromonosporaceae bacterium]
MEGQYETFCITDPHFYDVAHSQKGAEASFPIAERALPEGWRRVPQDDWFVFYQDQVQVPPQGWKIHASACRDNAERILETVWDYCVPRRINFKFLRSATALWNRVSKYAPRGHSGKLVTIYPRDEAECETILRELGELLQGEPSPYILSDLRYGDGPLYVRYGAFAPRFCRSDTGRIVPAIADHTGALVPDRRGPSFHVPPWITLPEFLAPHLEARNAVTVADLPYKIERVLHFSNGGGIYVGRDTRDGRQVVLKEGRPHCGLDARGDDAVRRVEREHEMLRRLEGIPGIPKAYDLFWVGEHRFLAMEFITGAPLNKALVKRYPLIDIRATPDDFARHAEWAQAVHRQVETILTAIHERGVVYGDLHLFNIMVRDPAASGAEPDGAASGAEPDGAGAQPDAASAQPEVALLDFEVASLAADDVRPGLGNPGFAAPRGVTGAAVDRYALACLRLALFLPMTDVLWLHRPKA